MTLANTSTDPSLLTLEVMESVLVRDQARALVVLDELKEIGVKLALDDFGTGYSSLSCINEMPVDSIKVDQSFVAKLAEQPSSREIVNAIIGLAHGLGMSVVAEGVETAERHGEPAQLGADLCQGFYFARPMGPKVLDPLIRPQADGSRAHLPIRNVRPGVGAAQRRELARP